MSRFEYKDSNHSYTLDGKRLTGVTTILGVISKPALIGWAARMAVEYIEEAPMWAEGCKYKVDGKVYTITQEVLDDARKAHAQKRDKAAEAGISIHEWIESFIEDPSVELPEDKIANAQAKQFLAWQFKNKVKFLESEKRIYSEKLWFAGTVDAVAEIDGKKYVVDFKTMAKMWDKTPFFQTAGYQICLEEMGEKDFHGSLILLLPKDGKLEEHYDYDLATNKKGFLAALELYRTLNS